MNNLLAKVVFRGRTRFFHKLHSLGEIIETLQREAHAVLESISEGSLPHPERAWQLLEVLGYDLNTCMGETTILLKSFFCVLPPEELGAFRERLIRQIPSRPSDESESVQPFDSE